MTHGHSFRARVTVEGTPDPDTGYIFHFDALADAMICSAIIVATPLMAGVAVLHVVLMDVKARNEERHMLRVHGEAYARYLRRTGRFVPRLGATPA